MKPIINFHALVLAALLLVAPNVIHAKQTSLDSRIIKAFESIDERTNTHEQDVVAMRARLDNLAITLEDQRKILADLPHDPGDPQIRKQRRTLHGKIINLSAEYLNQSYKLVDSAAAVISANLSDLAKLSTDIRKSPNANKGALKLQGRIQKNIAAGRSMRNALVRLRSWAKQNPDMAGRFQSLRRITKTLDRRISIDKVRLKSRHTDATGAIRNRRQESLDRTVDRLGDMYAEVAAEKESLKDLRDELAIAIQLGRLEMTQEVAERAIPKVDSIRAPSTSVASLKDMASVIGELNSSMVVEANLPVAERHEGSASTGDVGQPTALKIGGFSNF
jgi:hypothetical protein